MLLFLFQRPFVLSYDRFRVLFGLYGLSRRGLVLMSEQELLLYRYVESFLVLSDLGA